MKKTLIFILMLAIMIVPALAVDLDYVFKQGNDSSISRPCYNTGDTGYCSNESTCALTVFNPDNSVLIFGKNMTNQIYTHNYTLPNLNDTGVYKVDMACSDHNITGYDSFFFGVNQAGKDYNDSVGSYFILGIVILFMILFALASYFMENSLKLVFLLMTFLMLPVTLWVSLDIARNSFMSTALIAILSSGYGISLICFAAMCLFVLVKLTMQLKINKNAINTSNLGNKASPAYWNRKQKYKANHSGEEYD
jgi:hypothetical protein